MAEIYVNSTSPIKTKIFWGGEIVDADSAVTVEVYDITEDPLIFPAIDPTTLFLVVTATKLENDFGTYQIVLPITYSSRNRKLKFKWIYRVNNIDSYHFSYADVVTPYANLAEAIEDLNFGTDQSDPEYKTYHDLQMAEKYARKIIENYCGQKFYLYDSTEVIYGSGSYSLPLPAKINSLYTLHVEDYLLVDNIHEIDNWGLSTIISESGFGIRVDTALMTDNTVYTANGMVPPTVNDISFNGAFKNNSRYRVSGKFGWASVPDEVEQACIQLMGHFFDKDRHWKDQYLKSVQTFDWKFDYSSDVHTGTGCSYADKLLSDYVINQAMVI
jgi:hypothetical protein